MVLCECTIPRGQVVCEDKEQGKEVTFFFFGSNLNTHIPIVPTGTTTPLLQELSTGAVIGDYVRHKKIYVNTTLEVSLLLLCVA